ncbi:hypothetical protein B7494_g8411 [Chlorociboria aeruginascens]|nr:hypothetical protein B7494_g8411 [Chlorociboria aeruginascens]
MDFLRKVPRVLFPQASPGHEEDYIIGLKGIYTLQTFLWVFLHTFVPATVDGNITGDGNVAGPTYQVLLRKVLSVIFWNEDLLYSAFILLSARVICIPFIKKSTGAQVAGSAFRRVIRLTIPTAAALGISYLIFSQIGYGHIASFKSESNNTLIEDIYQIPNALAYFNSVFDIFWQTNTYATQAGSLAFPTQSLWVISVVYQQSYTIYTTMVILPYTRNSWRVKALLAFIASAFWVQSWAWYSITGLLIADVVHNMDFKTKAQKGLKIWRTYRCPTWVLCAAMMLAGLIMEYIWVDWRPQFENKELEGHTGLYYSGGLNEQIDLHQPQARDDNYLLITGFLLLLESSDLLQMFMRNPLFVYLGNRSLSWFAIQSTLAYTAETLQTAKMIDPTAHKINHKTHRKTHPPRKEAWLFRSSSRTHPAGFRSDVGGKEFRASYLSKVDFGSSARCESSPMKKWIEACGSTKSEIDVAYGSLGSLEPRSVFVECKHTSLKQSANMSPMAVPKERNIGIKAIEIYIPNQCVDQAELEKYDGVSAGKYTLDIYSIALTAVSSLLSKYKIDPLTIGRLEVGTETLLDKSKSIKSVLMQLFAPSGNTNIEGIDTINACYGGTNALFNAVNWVESSAWDGRDAIVVAGDIALYGKGPARPTGGAGCIAMLVGPNAPFVLEPGLRGSYMQHVYDFYKPDFHSEFPVVDGHFSINCYTEAVDGCYKAYNAREAFLGGEPDLGYASGNTSDDESGEVATEKKEIETESEQLPIDRFDYLLFHAPTCKLVSKSYARLMYNDYKLQPTHEAFKDVPAALQDISTEASITDKNIEKTFLAASKKRFQSRVRPALEVPTQCGNMYTGSLYSSICGLLTYVGNKELQGKKIGAFSYGSGLASSLFSFKVVGDVDYMREKLNLEARLAARNVVTPEVYSEMCDLRSGAHQQKSFVPKGSVDGILPGTYYLTEVDEMWRRQYAVKA